MFAVRRRGGWDNAWWADPVLLGKYPEDGLAFSATAVPNSPPADLDHIKQPPDSPGLTIYSAPPSRRGPEGLPERVPVAPESPRAGVDWPLIVPACLYWGPRFFYENYR